MKNFRDRIFPLIFSLLAAGSVFLIFPIICQAAGTSLDGKIAREEKNMQRLEKQVTYHKKAVAEASKKEKSVLQQLSTYDQKKKLAQQKIRLLELKQKKVSNTIEQLSEQIKNSESAIIKMKDLLRERMLTIYKYGGLTELNLMVSSRSAHEAMTTSYLLSQIAHQDQEMIAEMARKKEQLQLAAEKLVKEKKTLEEQSEELALQKNTFSRESANRNVLLSKLRKQKALHLAAAKDLERSQREIKKKISVLLTKKRKAAAQKNNSSVQRKTDITYMKAGGRLLWPTQGKVTSRFGTRVHPVFKTKTMHTGIDIAARKGSRVNAAESGEVLYSGWLRGYGQIVILDHGHDLTTVYAHLDSISVDEGAGVKKGQPIGTVGNTGVATGPHLHFEVRQNGEARDPLKYLSR
jgi:murein DD-endopeptidase MepM/ murein hydrolase activator NlpD